MSIQTSYEVLISSRRLNLSSFDVGHDYASKEAWKIYKKYLDAFESLWGIAPVYSMGIGLASPALCHAEHMEWGDEAYKKSVTAAIRNAFYSFCTIDQRMKTVLALPIVPPVLDYGCGVGFMPAYLINKGIEPCYGYDLGGPKEKVMTAVGVSKWNKETPNTILCFDVLEHLADPMKTLNYLRSFGCTLYANCDKSEDPAHIAPQKERDKVIASLKDKGEYLEVF